MIIIQLAGGLGNQMFQYALYLQLKSLGKEVKIDDVAGFVQDEKRDPALAPFGISYERAVKKELIQMLDSSMLPWNRVRRKLFGRKRKGYFEEDKRYHPEIMAWDDIYLEGYWQTEKYFEAIEDKIRGVYDTDKLLQYIIEENQKKIPKNLSEQAAVADQMPLERLLMRVDATDSVSMHIRRGDYLLPQNQALFGGICTEAYYKEAMERMKQEHPNCFFYLFTNDKEWLKKQIAEATGTDDEIRISEIWNVEIVDLEEQKDHDYAEFVLMSRCKHNILANSSFSWWASYLNKNENKTVFAPDRWLNGWDCEDIYRKDMQKVQAK